MVVIINGNGANFNAGYSKFDDKIILESVAPNVIKVVLRITLMVFKFIDKNSGCSASDHAGRMLA